MLTIDDVDDFNKVKFCRHCNKEVVQLFPVTCPHCEKPFESKADFFFRWAGFIIVALLGAYLWQKVLIGY